jgi:peptide/nickel transport system permease protein
MQLFWRRFRRDKVAIVALIFIVMLVLVAIFAGVITRAVGAPAPNVQQTSALDDFGLPEGPSSEHIMGVDPIGRDVFSRVLHGARVSLAVALIGTGLSVFFGVTRSSQGRSTSCSRSPCCCSGSGWRPRARARTAAREA